VAAERRHTERRPFRPEPVPPELVDELVAGATDEGVYAYAVRRPDAQLDLAVAFSWADRVETEDPAYRAELARWVPEYKPRGCPRGAAFSWYTYPPTRVRYPYVRGVLLEMWREAKARLGDPVLAWADVVGDPERARRYKAARGKGGLVRATWDEAAEIVAAAHVHTIKRWGPDRVAGFSPIPAMSMVSHATAGRTTGRPSGSTSGAAAPASGRSTVGVARTGVGAGDLPAVRVGEWWAGGADLAEGLGDGRAEGLAETPRRTRHRCRPARPARAAGRGPRRRPAPGRPQPRRARGLRVPAGGSVGASRPGRRRERPSRPAGAVAADGPGPRRPAESGR
jgi:hypothetical protein